MAPYIFQSLGVKTIADESPACDWFAVHTFQSLRVCSVRHPEVRIDADRRLPEGILFTNGWLF